MIDHSQGELSVAVCASMLTVDVCLEQRCCMSQRCASPTRLSQGSSLALHMSAWVAAWWLIRLEPLLCCTPHMRTFSHMCVLTHVYVHVGP
jgi:hypothetical protein